MKTLIIILILLSFIQSTIIPLNLVLIILICRSFIISEKSNFYLAFAFGLLISFLNSNILGLQSIIYLLLIALTQILSKSRLTANYLLIIPLNLVLLSINNVASSLSMLQSIHLWPQVVIEAILSLPTLYLIKIWEERFVVRKEIKLKL